MKWLTRREDLIRAPGREEQERRQNAYRQARKRYFDRLSAVMDRDDREELEAELGLILAIRRALARVEGVYLEFHSGNPIKRLGRGGQKRQGELSLVGTGQKWAFLLDSQPANLEAGVSTRITLAGGVRGIGSRASSRRRGARCRF